MAQPVARPPREAVSVQPLHFRLDGVALGTNLLGNGAYAEVREASVQCAAKILHSVLVDSKLPRNQERFEQECSILGECFHPNIVRFFGVSVNPTTGQTALLMELMGETLTHFLEVTYKDRKLPYCHQLHISHDIANGVKYLHSKRIIHRDLSSNNVLLKGSTITAKISDFGMSMLQDEKHTRLTQCPGTAVYMPPEAFGIITTCYEKIDSFQMGVLMLQIATQKFPAPSDRFETRPNPQSPTGYSLDPISEKVRRDNHLQLLREPRVLGDHKDPPKELEDHPMLDHLILDCLEDKEKKRPTAKFVYDHLLRLMMDERYKRDCRKHRVLPRISGEGLVENGVERNSRVESRESELEARIQALSRENQQLREQLERDGRESREHLQAVEYKLRQQLEQRVSTSGAQVQALERDNHTLQGQLKETQRRMQAQINNLEVERRQLRHHNGQLVQQIEGYRHQQNASVSQQVVALQNQLATQAREHQAQIDGLVGQYQQATQEAVRSQASLREELKVKETELERLVARHTCRIIGAPLQSITANSRGCIEAELCDSDGKPRNVGDNTPLSAVLSPVTNSADPPIVCEIKPLEKRFEVSYELSDPGKYQLSIRFQNKQILGGIALSVYPDPRPPHVLVPRRFVTGLKKPYGIAVNKHREMLVSELYGNKVSVYDIDKPGKVKCCIGETVPMMRPRGVATDEADNVYVTSDHKLQKFRSETYELLNSVGADDEGDQDHEFHSPSGLTVFGNEVYVCDQQNHRIQVFDLDLNFVRTIASNRKGQYQFNLPGDVAFDREGRMYVAEHGRERVQVLTADGKHLQMIGERERMKPESVHVVNDYLYVSDFSREHRVAVFQTSGKHVASLGSEGDGEGQWLDPRGIASCEGRIYVCGSEDGHVHVLLVSVK